MLESIGFLINCPAFLTPLASRRPNPVMYWRNGEGIESLVDSKFLS